MKEPIFKASHIVKQFGPTIALNDVDIEIYPGEIRGFIGENGSGKSTMSAIMTGIYERTSGTMEFHGKPWEPKSMIEALNGGIGIIVQENGTIGNISVAENIYLGELNQFSGRNFFEEYKVEDFSRLFDLSLKEFDDLKSSYIEKVMNAKDNKEAKELVKEARDNALFNLYNSLNDELLKRNEVKLQNEQVRFDKEAERIFEEYKAKVNEIDEFYNKNEDKVEAYLVERRRVNAHKENKSNYRKLCKKLDNESYMIRKWLKDDVMYLKNHYLNACKEVKDLIVPEKLKNFRLKFLDTVFGIFVNSKKLRK